MLYKDALEITKYVSQVLREAAREAEVLLYAPGADTYFEELVNADRVLYFNEGPRVEVQIVVKASPRAQRSQTTLETFT